MFFLLFMLLLLHNFVLIVDIICIDPITGYLSCNVRNIFHIYSSSVNAWCITSFPVCNLIYFSVTSSFRLVSFVSEYKLNPNSIWVYVPPFFTSIKASLYLPLNFIFVCFIAFLYTCVYVVCILYGAPYSSSVNAWCITSFPVCNLIYFSVTSSFRLVSFVSEYKLNPNSIWVYVPPFFTSIKASLYLPLNFIFVCFIAFLYTCVYVVCILYGVLYFHVV